MSKQFYAPPKTQGFTISFGADPEFFFSKNGEIIGSEKILPKDGVVSGHYETGDHEIKESKIIIDGIQAELNPLPATCRETFASEIGSCFARVFEELKQHPEVGVDFTQTVHISDAEMASLSDKSKKFGCSPSKNAHNKRAHIAIKDASKYMYRSAGGHIHIGHNDSTVIKKVLAQPERVVPILDIMLGNTCVLIDRNPGNVERRKVYGRAGEYRMPPHGIEYRTLSNFWLRSYPMMSFVMGMARYAVSIVASSNERARFDEDLLSRVRMKNVVQAINENDFDLAMHNFKAVKEFIKDTGQEYGSLTPKNLPLFDYFVKKGIDHWFKENPLEHWIKVSQNRPYGWESFLTNVVGLEMKGGVPAVV